MQHLTEFEGTLVRWNDSKGFGFLLSTQGGQEIFAHIKSFDIKGRPQLNATYRFGIETNASGQKRATHVREPKPVRQKQSAAGSRPPPRRPHTAAQWGTASLLAIPLFVIIYCVCLFFFHPPPYALGAYLLLSLVAFGMYAADKAAAAANRRRIPEQNLHWVALLSGWPGALIAQQVLRHKSVKAPFRSVFWSTVVINITVFVGLSVWQP